MRRGSEKWGGGVGRGVGRGSGEWGVRSEE